MNSVADSSRDKGDQFRCPKRIIDFQSFEGPAIFRAQVSEQAGRIGVEMQKRPAAAIEDAARGFPECGESAQSFKKRLKLVEICRTGVSHGWPPKTFIPGWSASASMASSPAESP